MKAESITIHALPNVMRGHEDIIEDLIEHIDRVCDDYGLIVRRSGTVRHPVLELSTHNVASTSAVIDMIQSAAEKYGVRPEDILRTMANEIETQRRKVEDDK